MSKCPNNYYLTPQEIEELRTDAKAAMQLASVLTAQNIKPLRFSFIKKNIKWLNYK
ncbi:MAG: hypothetical protein ACKOUU_01805 [Acinetobacter tjernbergiae]